MGKLLIIPDADFSSVAIGRVTPVTPKVYVDITDKLVQGFIYNGFINTPDHITQGLINGHVFVLPTKTGTVSGLFSVADNAKIVIPSGYYYRICFNKGDGSAASGVANDSKRGDAVQATNSTTITTAQALDSMDVDTSVYKYWSINISKHPATSNDQNGAMTIEEGIADGIKVYIEQ